MGNKILISLFVLLLIPTIIFAVIGFYYHKKSKSDKREYVMYWLTLLFGTISVIGIAISITPEKDSIQIDNSYTDEYNSSSKDSAKTNNEEATNQAEVITVTEPESPKSPYYVKDLGVDFTGPQFVTSMMSNDESLLWYHVNGTADLEPYGSSTVIGNTFYLFVDCHRIMDEEAFSKIKCHTSLYTPDGEEHNHDVYVNFDSSLGMLSAIGIVLNEEPIEGETYIMNVELIIDGKSYVANDMRIIYHEYSSKHQVSG